MLGVNGLAMEISVVNKENGNLPAIEKSIASPSEGARQSVKRDVDTRAALRRFNPDVRITAEMMWHPPEKVTTRKSQDGRSCGRVAWNDLFRQIVLGLFEVLIPWLLSQE